MPADACVVGTTRAEGTRAAWSSVSRYMSPFMTYWSLIFAIADANCLGGANCLALGHPCGESCATNILLSVGLGSSDALTHLEVSMKKAAKVRSPGVF